MRKHVMQKLKRKEAHFKIGNIIIQYRLFFLYINK